MAQPIEGLSSMATKGVLAELAIALRRRRSLSVRFASAGGVEVAHAIRAGAKADLAVLSAEAMAALDVEGFLVSGTRRPLFVSDVVAATPEGMAVRPLATEDDLRSALLDADRIAYSTGPSGTALIELIERWELVDAVHPKLVQVAPGTPVGDVLAGGDADLGFQQRSEFSGVSGVRVLGPLPGAAAIRSTFSGAVLARTTNTEGSREVLEFVRSKDVEGLIRAAGMSTA